jgi:hypothetical protein
MMYFQFESLAFAVPTLRPKRDDSINNHYRQNWQLFQRLDASPALQDVGCVFFAASVGSFVSFLGRDGLAVESPSPCRHRAAANPDRVDGLPVMKRLPESS